MIQAIPNLRSSPVESSHNGRCDYSNPQNAPKHTTDEYRLYICRTTEGAHTNIVYTSVVPPRVPTLISTKEGKK